MILFDLNFVTILGRGLNTLPLSLGIYQDTDIQKNVEITLKIIIIIHFIFEMYSLLQKVQESQQ